MRNENIVCSLILPIYNEAGNIPQLYERLVNTMRELGEAYEMIFVDDGSTDRSLDLLRSLHSQDAHVRIVRLSRNFGHQRALTAGLDCARGRAVIFMDTDLQHPPEMIPELVKRWQHGYDIVYTVREDSEGAGSMKRVSSYIFYKLINLLSGVRIPRNAADFRLMDKRAADVLQEMREEARFVRGLVAWLGFSQTGVSFKADRRYTGHTNYSLLRMLRFAIDGMISFSILPLRMSLWIGAMAAVVGFAYAVYALCAKFVLERVVTGWTSIIVVIIFFGGVQLMALGVIGEYVGRIYSESKRRPLYIVQERIGFERDEEYSEYSG